MKTGVALTLLLSGLLATPVSAATRLPAAVSELRLLSEHVVEGMPSGNLSGLAWCGGTLWTLSDREDDRLYKLTGTQGVLQAQAEVFSAPPVPVSALSWGQQVRNDLSGIWRGGDLDFEGLSCDAEGNRYLVSEAHVAVLQIPAQGQPNWLQLPSTLLQQARAWGLLEQYNALFEGLTVDPTGTRLWLAAEREGRGLLGLQQTSAGWLCQGSCVLLSDHSETPAPVALGAELLPKDFADLAFFKDKLFTLERLTHQICRRNPQDGSLEHCWSFAGVALTEARRYDLSYGLAEALWIDAEGAWLGIDNGDMSASGGHTRGDGESRPVVWRLAAPAGGWAGNL